jgi:ribosome-associated protein
MTRLSTLEQIRIAVEAAQDKKAEALEVLDLESVTSMTSYFVICHGSSQRQVQAIAQEVSKRLRDAKVRPAHLEGENGADWVLIDYLDFVVHVFTRERRTFYALEKLWSEAPRVEFPLPAPAQAGPRP